MTVQVIIRSQKDPSYYIEQEFYNPEEINIGSHESNHIILADKNQRVSEHHVEIVRAGGSFFLIDKQSEYGTMVQGEKIQPDIPLRIEAGINFTIGEYKLTLALTKNEEQQSENSLFIKNPFDEDIHELNSILNRLAHKYQTENNENKKFLLIQACREIMDATNEENALQILIRTMNENMQTKNKTPSESFDDILEMFFGTIRRLFRDCIDFRKEFLGVSAEYVQEGFTPESVEQLIQYLFDPEITGVESQKRLARFHQKLNNLISHQKALVNGYRGGVSEGICNMFSDLSSTVLENTIDNSYLTVGFITIPFKWFPRMFKSKLLETMKQECQVLNRGDENYIEERYFRSSFVKQYKNNYRESAELEEVQNPDEVRK